jgi:hypothetical protein
MRFMSFGPDAGHLMEELLSHAGAGMAGDARLRCVLIQPEADAAAMSILREAAEGGWVIEILDAGDEPDSGEGERIMVRGISQGEIPDPSEEGVLAHAASFTVGDISWNGEP